MIPLGPYKNNALPPHFGQEARRTLSFLIRVFLSIARETHHHEAVVSMAKSAPSQMVKSPVSEASSKS